MNASVNPKVPMLAWHLNSSAPPAIQQYVNPDYALDVEVKFIPSFKITKFDLSFQSYISILLLCLTLGMAYVFNFGSTKPTVWVQVSVITFFSLMFIISLWSLKTKISEYKYSQTLLSEGKYRRGLFLLKDAMLINYNEHFYLAPKRQIERFTAIFRGRSQGRRLEMVLNGKKGKKIVMDLDFLKLNNVMMQRELTTWLQAGGHLGRIYD